MSGNFTEKQSKYCERHETLPHPSLGILAGHLKSQTEILKFEAKLFKLTPPVLEAGHFSSCIDQITVHN